MSFTIILLLFFGNGGISRAEAVAAVFPDAQIQSRTLFLTEAQHKEAAALSGEDIESPMIACYTAVKAGRIVGRAYVDTHYVRTKKESLLIILDSGGVLQRIEVTAFLDDPVHLAPEDFYRQYEGKSLSDDLQIDRAIRPVAGATLTSRATNRAVRRVMAIDRVLHGKAEERVTREVSMMGTSCTLTAFGESRPQSVELLEKLIRTLEGAERELSTWREGSALSGLNRWPVGEPFQAAPGLCRLFPQLQHWVSETGGAFDPAIGALIGAWGLRAGGRLPLDSEIEEARLRSGMRHYRMSVPECRITRTAEAAIDCGAFGKGEALDRLRPVGRANGTWMVNLGGQVAVQGAPPGAGGWEVSIAHPQRRHEPALRIRMESGSLATSGGSERDAEASGRRIGHILDPRTGLPAGFDGSVSVWHESALVADILSTALYVMGPDEGIPWAEERGIAACYLAGRGSRLEVKATAAFRRRFQASFIKPITSPGPA